MKKAFLVYKKEPYLILITAFLLLYSIISLNSVAPFIFPTYYLFIFLSIILFLVFSQIDFEILSAFSFYFYIGSCIFLLLPIIFGQLTRGAFRWLVVGELTVQPAEIVRPFLLIFFATYLTKVRINLKRFISAILLLFVPLALIFLQPSLGVSILTFIGFVGVFVSLDYNKRLLVLGLLLIALSLPILWGLLAPYQRGRILTAVSPGLDPLGADYNRIQSIISVGSGGIGGKGFGKGVQTQLSFLPERHSDFIFASISEEVGFIGSGLLLVALFFMLYRIAVIVGIAGTIVSRSFASGAFLMLFSQVVIHVAMNLGIFPITGLPLPLISAGGSSLVSTMIIFGILVRLKKAS